jgi:hypothetical protein
MIAFEVRVKKKNNKINSFHFEANNIDHAKRRAEKHGRIISIREVKPQKLIGSIKSMNLQELITPRKNFNNKPMISENMTIGQFFNNNNNNNRKNNGGLNATAEQTRTTEAVYSGRNSRRSFSRRIEGDKREARRSDSEEN